MERSTEGACEREHTEEPHTDAWPSVHIYTQTIALASSLYRIGTRCANEKLLAERLLATKFCSKLVASPHFNRAMVYGSVYTVRAGHTQCNSSGIPSLQAGARPC